MKVLSIEELKKKIDVSTEHEETEALSLQSFDTDDSAFKEIYNYCVYFLARREYSKLELLQKLIHKQYDEDLAQEVLVLLEQKGLQSDWRFTEMFIRSRIAKAVGPFKLRIELAQKGIASELIERGFEACGCDWFELAFMAAQKKVSTWGSFEVKQKSQLSRFLQGRGFEHEQTAYALAQVQELFRNRSD